MNHRRTAIAGLALVAALGLTGCGPEATDAGATPAGTASAAPADARAELAAAAAALAQVPSLKLDLEMSKLLTASGVTDTAGTRMEMTMEVNSGGRAMKINLRKLQDDMWMQFGGEVATMLGAKSGQWMHVDAKKVGNALNLGGGPADAAKLVEATSGVTRTGEHAFAGQLDMTRAPNSNPQAVQQLGDKAKSVPFTARTDDQDRLVELVLDLDAAAPGTGDMKTTYSDFGTPVKVQAPPAGQVIEMPAQLQGMFGG